MAEVNCMCMRQMGLRTFAVVLLHVLNALEAASIASFVSDMPISGTVPSSFSVAGSKSWNRNQHGVNMYN